MQKINRIIAFSLSVLLMFNLSINVLAESISENNTNSTDSSVPVTLQVVPANFSVTLPTTLPVNVDAAGVVTVADNATITNNKKGPIAISGVKVTPKNNWAIVPITSDFTKVEANAKQIGFSLLNLEVPANGILSVNALNSIPGNQSMALPYGSKLAVQKAALSEQPLDVMFTIGWYTGGNNVADTDEALLALDKNYLSMMVGAEETITATYVEKATPKARMAMLLGTNDITFTSTDTAIATVDANGLVTAVKEGTAKIIATANGLEAACDVKVNTLRVPLTAIDVNKTNVTLNKGTTEKLVLMYNPDKFTGTAEVTWSSNDTNIATVSPLNESHDGQSGEPSYAVITGVAGGNAIITVTVVSGSDTFNKTISVKVNEPMTDLSVSEDIDVKVREKANIIASKIPSNTTDNNLIAYESTDPSIATVDNAGLVTGIKEGNTTITVKSGYFTKTVNVVVSSYPTPAIGTKYTEGSYTYSYGQVYGSYWTNSGLPGWGVAANINRTQTLFEPPLEEIQNYPVVSYRSMFAGNTSTTLKLTGDWKSSNITDTYSMFYNTAATTVDLGLLNTSNVSNMARMFDSPKITTITGLENLNTSNVTDMSGMFYNSAIITLNLSNFDTSKVTNMGYMFYNSKATSLNLNNWDTSNVTDMSQMFQNSKATTIMGLENFDTSNVVNMANMFDNSVITVLNLNNWNTSKVTNMSNMFKLTSASSPQISNWDTSNVTNMSYMFYMSNAIEKTITLNINNWNTSKVTDMSYMFYGNGNTYGSYTGGTLDLSNWNTSNVTNMNNMFRDSKAEVIKLDNWDTSSVTNMSAMFQGRKNMQGTYPKALDLSSFNTSSVINMSDMFYDCNATTIIGLTNFNTSNTTNMRNMFNGTKADNLDLSSFDTSKVTDMSYMFYGAKNINISNFNTSNVTTMESMFQNSYATTLDLSNFNTSKVINMSNMFRASKILFLDLRSFEISNTTSLSYMFKDSSSTFGLAKNEEMANLFNNSSGNTLTYKFSGYSDDSYAYSYDEETDSYKVTIIDLSQTIYKSPLEELNGKKVISYNKLFYNYPNTTLTLSGDWVNSNITDMSYMFANSKATTIIGLENFNTSNVTNMKNMFQSSCVTTLDLSNFDTSNVIYMDSMFYASKATTLNLSSFNTSNVTTMGSMFGQSLATTIDLSSFNTSKVTDMSAMFSFVSSNSLDLSSFNTSNVTDMSWMFNGSQIPTLDLSNFDTSKVTNMSYMFQNSKNTTITGLSNWNTTNVINTSDMFNGSIANKLDLSNWNTPNLVSITSMFANSKAITIDISNFNTSKVTNMSKVFYSSSVTDIIGLNSFDTSNVTDMSQMFYVSKAATLDLSSFDTSKVTNIANMFYASKTKTGYARTQIDADKFNSSSNKPTALKFIIKE